MDEHRAVLNKVESLLDSHPDSEVELVVVGAPAMSSRGNSLPGLLIRSGLDVAVRDNTLRVWPPRSTFKFRAFPVKRTGRSDPRRDERR